MGGSRPPQEGERQPRSRDGGTGVPVVLEKLSDLRDKPEAGSGGLPPSVTSGESPEAARESRALPSGLRIHRGVCPITRRGISFRYRLVDMANYVPEHRQARTPNIVIFLPTAPTGPRRRGPGRKYKEAA